MNDAECVRFLQWALPRLQMRWSGFRRVRRQVCKRLQRRMEALQLEDVHAYRDYLDEHAGEWTILDELCRVTISRFYRNKAVFAFLGEQVLPYLINEMEQRQESTLRIWCAGSGAGEEPYTLALLWAMRFQSTYPALTLSIVGTDINPEMLARARQAVYPYSAVKNLPTVWREAAFVMNKQRYHLRPGYKTNVDFLCQDLRTDSPGGPFQLVLCRNLAFTYFDEPLQHQVAQRLRANLVDGGVLVVGVHEELPFEGEGFKAWSRRLGIYRRQSYTS